MKVRKLAVALALAGALGAEMAHAVGLGQIKLESYLNQPLKAQINILDVGDLSPDQILVGLASNQDFSQAGIKRTYDLSKLKFKVVRESNGNMVVNVTTDNPVHEPYLDFLVDLNWPNGRVMREYTLLVDPPTYEQGEQAAPVHAAASSSESPAPQSQPARNTSRATTASAPATTSSASSAGGGTYGPTKSSDTLWGIAEKYKPSDKVTTQQEMLAIQDQNPDAFVDGNINRMKRGQVLRMPSMQQVQSRTRHQAVREVIAQNRAFKSMQSASQHPAVNATGANGGTQGGGSEAASGQDQLKLVVANKGKESVKGSHGGGNGGTSQASLRNKLTVTQEQVDKLQRDNADLNARLQDLQDQVKTLKRLIELKNDQLTALQTEAGQKGKKPASATSGQVAGTSAPAVTSGTQQASTSASAAAGTAMTSAPASAMKSQPAATSQPAQSASAPAVAKPTSQPAASTTAKTEPTAQAKTPSQPEHHVKPKAAPPAPEMHHPRSFWDNLVHQLMSNPLYQLGAGGVGILVLLGLWLLARRNAHHEKQFYENLKDAEEGEPLDLGLDEDESGSGEHEHDEVTGSGEDDALSEADVYIAYGRFDQAAHLLEEAISAEPSRTDLRLKLLETYAESGNEDAFDKQFHELEAIADDDSLSAAQALRDHLQADQGPSISDLESELKTGVASSFGETASDADSETAEADEAADETEGLGIDWDLDSALDETETNKEAGESAGAEDEFATAGTPETEASDHGSIDFDLGDLELEEGAGTAEPETDETEDLDFSSLSDELDSALGEETTQDEDQGVEYTLDTEGLGETGESETTEDLDLSGLDDLTLDTESEDETAKGQVGETDEFVGIDFDTGEETAEETPSDETEALEEDASDEIAMPSDTAASVEEAPAESQEEPDLEALTSEPDDGPIDESFLDELDAELEKVTEEADSEAGTQTPPEAGEVSAEETAEGEEEGSGDEDLLGDLELDVSDEDLALLEEASRAGDEEEGVPELRDEDQAEAPVEETQETQEEEEQPEIDAASEENEPVEQGETSEEPLLDVDLDESADALMEEGDALPDSEWDDLELSDSDLDLGEDDLGLEDEETPSSELDTTEQDLDLGDTDLGDLDELSVSQGSDGTELASSEGLDVEPEDDDFDFLAGTDEAATKLDLARAYIEMGDADGAKDILEEVSLEGNDEQKKEAQEMLKSIS